MPYVKIDDFETSLRAGKIGSLYLFDGPEEWLKERAVSRITKALVTKESADFNLDKLDGRSCTGGQVVTAAQSLPWMAERRLVIVQAGDEFTAAEARIVGEALSNLPKTTCLIFMFTGKANVRDEIPAQVISYGQVVTFWPPFANQMPSWIISEAKTRGKTMTYDAAMALADACADLQEICNELDKIALFVGKKPSIDINDVNAHGLPDEFGDFKDFEAAVWARNIPEALKQGRLLSEMGVRTEMVIPVMERVFRALLLGHHYLHEKGWGLAEVYTPLGLRGKTQQAQFAGALKLYSVPTLKKAFNKLVQTDYEVKTGVLSSELALSLLLADLLEKKAVAPARPPKDGFPGANFLAGAKNESRPRSRPG